MGEHNITNESLAFSMVLVLIAIVVSYREKLGLEKDIVWSICRAVIQLIIVGYVLKYIFNVNHAVLTLLMVRLATDYLDGAGLHRWLQLIADRKSVV